MIFFDLDNTILDHAGAMRNGAADFKQKYSDCFNEPIEDFIKRWHYISEKQVGRYLAGKLTEREQRRERMRELFSICGKELTDEEAESLFIEYLEGYQKYWKLFPDALEFIAGAGNLNFGIITNGGKLQQWNKIKKLGLEKIFDPIIVSGEVNCVKPEAEIFELACKLAGKKPEECIYVGDRLEIDAVGSKNAGMYGVWLNRDEEPLTGKVHVIKSLNEMNDVIKSHKEWMERNK